MSQVQAFRHQTYSSTPPSCPHYSISPPSRPKVGAPEFKHRMQEIGSVFREAGVAAIYLAHGTFVGTDTLGVLAELGRVFPSASDTFRGVIKRIVDKLAGEVGNYTLAYARLLEASLHTAGERRIPVRLFHWSSENHHIGRADGAVRLIDELASQEMGRGQRVLLWGHSHAGNVFALVTNLLAGNRRKVDQFFEATGIYYRWPLVGCVDIPVWQRVRSLLGEEKPPLADVPLDIATFGTPIRYGWDSGGYAHLLHFINHRPAKGLPKYRAVFPPKFNDIMTAADGDYIQQLGIAGTNVMPSVFAWRSWLADQRLNRLLQDEASKRGSLDRFQAGAIVPDEGTTLLVDYGRPKGHIAQHVAGHAVYTRKKWMLFHAEEVACRFYGAERDAA